jgi:hypothetical protein
MKYLFALLLVLVMCASTFAQGYRCMPTPPTGGPYYLPPVVYVVPYQYYYSVPSFNAYYQPQPYYHGYLPQYRPYYHYYHYGWAR